MARPYSVDLRERVVASVKQEGLSRRQAAARFGVGISTAINWVDRYEETGSVAPGKMGGHKPKKLSGEHAAWLRERCREKAFTLRGLVKELAHERGLMVDYRSVWEFVRGEKLSHKNVWPAPFASGFAMATARSAQTYPACRPMADAKMEIRAPRSS
jgi:putative transposase